MVTGTAQYNQFELQRNTFFCQHQSVKFMKSQPTRRTSETQFHFETSDTCVFQDKMSPVGVESRFNKNKDKAKLKTS